MGLAQYPTLQGVAFDIARRLIGSERRYRDGPLRCGNLQWEITYSASSAPVLEVMAQRINAFFMAHHGPLDRFLFADPDPLAFPDLPNQMKGELFYAGFADDEDEFRRRLYDLRKVTLISLRNSA